MLASVFVLLALASLLAETNAQNSYCGASRCDPDCGKCCSTICQPSSSTVQVQQSGQCISSFTATGTTAISALSSICGSYATPRYGVYGVPLNVAVNGITFSMFFCEGLYEHRLATDTVLLMSCSIISKQLSNVKSWRLLNLLNVQ